MPVKAVKKVNDGYQTKSKNRKRQYRWAYPSIPYVKLSLNKVIYLHKHRCFFELLEDVATRPYGLEVSVNDSKSFGMIHALLFSQQTLTYGPKLLGHGSFWRIGRSSLARELIMIGMILII